MAKTHEVNAYFSTNMIFALERDISMSRTTITLKFQMPSFQTKDAIEQESCKQI